MDISPAGPMRKKGPIFIQMGPFHSAILQLMYTSSGKAGSTAISALRAIGTA
jgi:hypothetical protein